MNGSDGRKPVTRKVAIDAENELADLAEKGDEKNCIQGKENSARRPKLTWESKNQRCPTCRGAAPRMARTATIERNSLTSASAKGMGAKTDLSRKISSSPHPWTKCVDM